MPMDKTRYPENWNEIARQVKEEAGWKCESCSVPHGIYIVRSLTDSSRWAMDDPRTSGCRTCDGELYKWSEAPAEFHDAKLTRVVLTVHHIGIPKPDGTPGDPNDKMDCRRENLIALCQKCHFDADRKNNLALSHQSRIAKKVEAARSAGQMEMF